MERAFHLFTEQSRPMSPTEMSLWGQAQGHGDLPRWRAGESLFLTPTKTVASGFAMGVLGVGGDHHHLVPWLFRLMKPGKRWPLAVLGHSSLPYQLLSNWHPCLLPEGPDTRAPGALQGLRPCPPPVHP